MDRLLSVSQASRMVGVSRKVLQQHISEGHVSAFEGYIRMSELLKAFPEANSRKSAMLEKTRLIREAAMFKTFGEPVQDTERLVVELHRAQVEMTRMQSQIESFKQLAVETETRLISLQEQCDRRDASMLGIFIGWYMNQVKLREPTA